MNKPGLDTHNELTVLKDFLLKSYHMQLSHIVIDRESSEYGACSFELAGKKVIFRVAKITPTKVGQFVTLWKRIGNGPIQPFESTDPIDIVIIFSRSKNGVGHFIFPKEILIQRKIFSDNQNSEGKRGFRVYSPWDKITNKQAENTQKWQSDYFFEIGQDFF